MTMGRGGLLAGGVRAVVAGATVAAGSLTGYLAVVSVAGGVETARRRRNPVGASTTRPMRFVVLVPAHDEAAVIDETLRSLRRLEHDDFEVHVVADNCTDDTADIVRASGWTVHERDAPDDPGKGPALNWLFDRLDATTQFDAVVVVDADTVVDPGFLRAAERAMTDTHDVAAQGFYGVRDPEESTAVGLRAAAFAARHHLRPLGRTTLGASSGLYGNGMVFRRELLRRRRWTGHLVEDAELQVELVLDGERVVYVPDAAVYAEIPTTLDRSSAQHRRWERGRVQLLRAAGGRLLRRSITGPRRWTALDSVLDLAVPPLSVLVATHGALMLTGGVDALAGSRTARKVAGLNALAGVLLVGHVVGALVSVGAPRSAYRSLATAPRALVWKLRTWLGIIVSPGDVTWTRTTRNTEDQR